MYTDPDRSDRILHELDVYKTRSDIRLDATECYVLVIPAKCGTRNTINQELGAPMTAPVLRRWRTYVRSYRPIERVISKYVV